MSHKTTSGLSEPTPGTPTRVGICGAAGRMGKTLVELCQHTPELLLGAAIEDSQHPLIGTDVGQMIGGSDTGVIISDSLPAVMKDFDVLINFTLADSLAAILECCNNDKKPLVIGTTGLTTQQQLLLQQTAASLPIVYAPNMSVGINLCLELLRTATRVLGDTADIEIIEAHHRDKRDSPSGTALRMGEVICEQRKLDLQKHAIYGRQGSSDKRQRDTIAFSTLRAGDIIGEHTVMFACEGERIEITHRASSRKTFAIGALRAARWLHWRTAGLYDILDVIGLHAEKSS